MQTKEKLDKAIAAVVRRRGNSNRIFSVTVKSYDDFLSNKRAIISVIREGVPYSLFKVIREYSPFSEGDWSVFLNISSKSLQRYKQEEADFKPSQSEKIIEVAEVTQKGIDTFGDVSKFKQWLETPNFSLGNVKPLELLKDSYGKEMVISELVRIDHGILI
jgi:putative toxin-antitoxin system antitoxin component (TIGR02293 family)